MKSGSMDISGLGNENGLPQASPSIITSIRARKRSLTSRSNSLYVRSGACSPSQTFPLYTQGLSFQSVGTPGESCTDEKTSCPPRATIIWVISYTNICISCLISSYGTPSTNGARKVRKL